MNDVSHARRTAYQGAAMIDIERLLPRQLVKTARARPVMVMNHGLIQLTAQTKDGTTLGHRQ